jgi:hypothetical protein
LDTRCSWFSTLAIMAPICLFSTFQILKLSSFREILFVLNNFIFALKTCICAPLQDGVSVVIHWGVILCYEIIVWKFYLNFFNVCSYTGVELMWEFVNYYYTCTKMTNK